MMGNVHFNFTRYQSGKAKFFLFDIAISSNVGFNVKGLMEWLARSAVINGYLWTSEL